jgi:hypothetical protein
MKKTYTWEEIDNLREQLEIKMLKKYGINAGGSIITIIKETFKENLE